MGILLLLSLQIAAGNADKLQQTAQLQDAKSNILCLAFSPDGKLLAAGEVDKHVRVWDSGTGKQLALLDGHTRQIAALGFSPDGSTLYSASYDHTVRAWDVASGKLKEVQAGDPSVGDVPACDDMRAEFTPDASLFVYGANLNAWDLKAKRQLKRDLLVTASWFALEPGGKSALAVSGTQKALNEMRFFRRWDLATGKSTDGWEGTAGAMYERVALSRDGARIAALDAGGDDNKWKIEIWDPSTKKLAAKGGFHPEYVNGMAFTKDGSALATAALDKTLKFWDAKTGKELASYKLAEGAMGLAFSPDGVRLAVAETKGAIRVWGVK
jgi:WD40 repeat protein